MSTQRPEHRPGRVRYLRSVDEIRQLPDRAADDLRGVEEAYAFRANDYYLGLIDWDDPDDPIRRLVVPDAAELQEWGRLDASNEAAHTVTPGVQHKYRDTALILAAPTCASYCRYCFRKRLFMDENDEANLDTDAAVEYVDHHREIRDVLLTGGDPLVLETDRLMGLVDRFADIEHVRVVRIGTKTLAFNPFRILEDPGLREGIARVVAEGTSVYVMAHFDHPRELTRQARRAIRMLQDAGAHVVNQCPLIRGVNDDARVLADLFSKMTAVGAPQYYLFQGRPTAGNKPYTVPLVEGWRIFDAARRRCSGLSRRARFCMSHATGKIEVVGVDRHHIHCRYHRARDPELESQVVICHRDDRAYWFSDLIPVSGSLRDAGVSWVSRQ